MASLKDILLLGEPIRKADGKFKVRVLEEDQDVNPLLEDLQGNILTWHKRNCAHYFFLEFDKTKGRKSAREFLKRLADGCEVTANGRVENLPTKDRNLQITSELDQRIWIEGDAYDRESKREYFVGVLLSRTGLSFLRTAAMPAGPDFDPAFLQGMANRSGILKDRPQTEWKVNTPGKPIDAMFILAHNPRSDCSGKDEILTGFRRMASEVGWIHQEEQGSALQSHEKDPLTGKRWFIEPFGYRDGISQPLFFRKDIEDDRKHSGKGADEPLKMDSDTPLDRILVADPSGTHALACGSYFVYRKLRQDVKSFYDQAKAMAETLGYEWPAQRNEILARIMGRYPDGRPLADGTHFKDTANNDFDYKPDQSGAACPFHAHIRKANPRVDVGVKDAQLHRIARRGLSFGAPLKRDSENLPLYASGVRGHAPKGEHGTHFMCAQSKIADQFEHIQAAWSNSKMDLRKGTAESGIDPIAGQSGEERILRIPPKDSPRPRNLGYAPFIEFQGGEYFFAPSIGFFKSLT